MSWHRAGFYSNYKTYSVYTLKSLKNVTYVLVINLKIKVEIQL